MDLKSEKSARRKPDRLGFKLAVVFGVALVSVTVLLFSWDLVMSALSGRATEGPRVVAPSGVDPKLENDLVAALEFDEVPEVERVTDPFVDRQGLGREVAAQLPEFVPPQSVGPTMPGMPVETPRAGERSDPTKETLARWENRKAMLRAGRSVGAESEVFSIDDLSPVSSFRYGNESPEINFFSNALGRRMRFKLGTRFHDGTLLDIAAGGVRFRLDSREIKFVPWKMVESASPKKSQNQARPDRTGSDATEQNDEDGSR